MVVRVSALAVVLVCSIFLSISGEWWTLRGDARFLNSATNCSTALQVWRQELRMWNTSIVLSVTYIPIAKTKISPSAQMSLFAVQ